jgi:hypothetical protein
MTDTQPPALFATLDAEREAAQAAERQTRAPAANGWPTNGSVNGNGAHPPSGEGTMVTDLAAFGHKAMVAECNEVARTGPGDRNNRLNTAAFRIGQLVADGAIDINAAQNNLMSAAGACGLPPTEAQSTIASGLRSGQQQPRGMRQIPKLQPVQRPAATTAPANDGWPAAPIVTPSAPYDQIWNARPVLSHVFAFSRACSVSPWAVLGSTLTNLIVHTPFGICLPPIGRSEGRKVSLGGEASLNLFVTLVGPSGSGKGLADSVARKVFTFPEIESNKTGSGEGIAHSYRYRKNGELEWVREEDHAALFTVTESDLPAAQSNRQGATLLPELRAAWSGETLGTSAYADPTRRVPVPAHQYRMCLVMHMQPKKAGWLLDDADGGTPQRFLWMPATDPTIPDEPWPEIDPLPWSPPLMSKDMAYKSGAMKVCDEAVVVLREAHLARQRDQIAPLDGQAGLCRLKVAAALAIMEERLEVSGEDWALSGMVMDRSDATRAEVQQTLRSVSKDKNHSRAVAQAETDMAKEKYVAEKYLDDAQRGVIRKLAKGPTTEGDLREGLSTGARTQLGPALARLLSDQAIMKTGEGTGAVYAIKE